MGIIISSATILFKHTQQPNRPGFSLLFIPFFT